MEVDCSEFAPDIIERLFMGSRDRMRENEYKNELLHSVATYLKEHPGLRELNHGRRQSAIKQSVKSDARTMNLFERMVSSSPAIATLLRGKGKIASTMKSNDAGLPFEGQRFPTYLRWVKGGTFLEKHCPVNSYCRLELETDAENNFLGRAAEPGVCIVEPEDWQIGAEQLWEGRLRVQLQPPQGTEVGTKVPVRITLLSEGPREELEAMGCVVVDPEAETSTKRKGEKKKHKGSVDIPEIREVKKENWSNHDFAGRSVATVDFSSNKTIIYVNMDNTGVARLLLS